MDRVGLYGALAPIYDEWQSCDGMIPFAEVVRDRLEPILRADSGQRPDGSLSFLDVGAGTGTLLAGLREQHPGWRLAGVDDSAAMLAVAVRKAGAASITWARARLDGALPFGPAFDAVGCFYDTLNHLPDAGALDRALGTMAAILRPGGLLVFDVTNSLGFNRWWRGRPAFAGAGWRLTIDMQFDPVDQSGLADVAILRQGEPERRFRLVERHFGPERIDAALVGAGFRTVVQQPWAPFAGDIPGKTWWAARLQRS
ncbi:MAG TPA: class I SAM-dependent methyltransferase [Polyangia bacterium]|nr:class I SAM-dependent methyltransferase [Polyangia bacterium]